MSARQSSSASLPCSGPSDAPQSSQPAALATAAPAPSQPSIAGSNESLLTATHAALFHEPEAEPACDVCGGSVERFDMDDPGDRPFALPGKAFYLWSRGVERRYEEAPLCASCAVALGITALANWEIEDEG